MDMTRITKAFIVAAFAVLLLAMLFDVSRSETRLQAQGNRVVSLEEAPGR